MAEKIVGYKIKFTATSEFTCTKYDCVADPIYRERKLLASDTVKELLYCTNCGDLIPAIVEPKNS